MSSSSVDEEWLTRFVARCGGLAGHLAAGRITFDEYASNVMTIAVYPPIEKLPEFVAAVPPDLVAPFADYLRTTLEPIDFMPSVRAFLTYEDREDVINRKKVELRPKYVRLYQLMCERDRAHREG